MNKKCTIMPAVTGGDIVPFQSPYLPITAKKIADEAVFVLGVLGGARDEVGVLHILKNTCDSEFGRENYTWSTVGAGYP